MFEKVNPSHPDKLADRVAGALVDLAYKLEERPRVAVEVLLGHGVCHIIAESSVAFLVSDVSPIVKRICGSSMAVDLYQVPQDENLARNQEDKMRCGDNGIFKGVPLTDEERELSEIARYIYEKYPYDGKYILSGRDLIVCQSHANSNDLKTELKERYPGLNITVNPLGDWIGGPDSDSGLTNRKLGSDMGNSITGGGLHGKDVSKADVAANIYSFLVAQEIGETVEHYCAIGDENIGGIPYDRIAEKALDYIKNIGGFEKLAEWGLI